MVVFFIKFQSQVVGSTLFGELDEIVQFAANIRVLKLEMSGQL